MINLKDIQQVYLVGIGGIGMSGLARYFAKRGCQVAGYDRTSTPLTQSMEAEGMNIVYTDDETTIPNDFKQDSKNLLVIFTPAIPKDSKILNYFTSQNIPLHKRSEVLGIISKGMKTIAIAGTHGKTTTSSMVAHILTHSGFGCSAFLGGITTNYGTNVLFADNDWLVVEADEFDRSFLTLHPDIAVITSTDADHLDIYGEKDALLQSFKQFASQLKSGGKLLVKEGLPVESEETYSAIDVATYEAQSVRIRGGKYEFDFVSEHLEIADIIMGMPGMHNVENATAAIAIAVYLGIESEKIKAALYSFTGVKRRFEYVVQTDNTVYIDDYAHHPEELRACLQSVRQLYPDKKLTVMFQPHLYSRTRDFAAEFSAALSLPDELILLDIYPARELPIEGVSSQMVFDKVTLTNKILTTKADAVNVLKEKNIEVLVTVGAGDIDTLVLPIQQWLANKG